MAGLLHSKDGFLGKPDPHAPFLPAVGETEVEQLKRYNAEKSSALDKAHQKIVKLQEENQLLKNIINYQRKPSRQ